MSSFIIFFFFLIVFFSFEWRVTNHKISYWQTSIKKKGGIMIMVAVMTIIEFHSESDDISTYILKGFFDVLLALWWNAVKDLTVLNFFNYINHIQSSLQPLLYIIMGHYLLLFQVEFLLANAFNRNGSCKRL